ncbi:MAG: FMN-binding protein [Gammaproteobacteria bacterium]|nr:FMN-binding protein [Gammaproteobacteria bacterium]MCW8909598.1 FMN-binding protein [Gammaproteobacteria bacterium]MCW9004848.1 FMN-binding protein [Gammaproteobacteria bacterium]MCW9056981.1 FMN-binding protein [Gammaproteobacteria bacterium]
MTRILLIISTLLILTEPGLARGTYQKPADFVAESFSGQPPEAKVLQLTDELKQTIEDILQHKYKGRRVRYWQQNNKTVWVLNEIGKKKPITTGIVIEDNKISHIKVLIFRESRGWEVKHTFFTKQYIDTSLSDNTKLDRSIDGISGATLSVRALTKQARIALFLHHKITQP